MKKRIINIVMIIVLAFTLFSCVSKPKVKNYESNNYIEKEIIASTEKISNSTVSIMKETILENNNRRVEVFGSAVIIDVKKEYSTNVYYALTTSDIAKQSASIKIYKNTTSISSTVETYAYNDKYMFGIISFKSTLKFDPVVVSKDTLGFDNKVGQIVLSIGTAYDLSNVNSSKKGTLTNDNFYIEDVDNYFFTHDAANNYGELGSGVFNLSGELIGINIHKTYRGPSPYERENILGHNIAIKSFNIVNALNNIDLTLLNNDLLSNDIFENESNKVNSYSLTDYEKSINNIYLENKNKVVKITTESNNYSGLIINKTGNIYDVLTTNIESTFASIFINGKEYESYGVNFINADLSVVRFQTTDNLDVYSSKSINNNIEFELLKSQYVVGIGYTFSSKTQSLAIGQLSKVDYLDSHSFMHDLRLNIGQVGSPLFNLNGELIGVYTGKINEIDNYDPKLAGEGLGFALNINYVNRLLNPGAASSVTKEKYISKNEYEENIIKTIEEVYASTVTIRTNTGLGSGVVIKKELVSKGLFEYYVLTNHHVIENSTEINIYFNNDYDNPIRGNSYTTVMSYDMGIVRFTSTDTYQVANSIFTDKNSSYIPVIGQNILAIGTPENQSRFGYVTSGIIGLGLSPYRYNSASKIAYDLAILHDASINPGNSGGPVFDLNGQLIAINASKLKPYVIKDLGAIPAERVGYSLNINELYKEFNKITTRDYILLGRDPKLGVTILTIDSFIESNPSYSDFFNITDSAFIVDSLDGTRLAKEVLEIGDILYEISGNRIMSLHDVTNVLLGKTFGDEVTFTILRTINGNITKLIVKVVLS